MLDKVLPLPKDEDGNRHASNSDGKRRMKAEAALHKFSHHGREESADVYPHVKNVVGPVLQVTAFFVEISDHR